MVKWCSMEWKQDQILPQMHARDPHLHTQSTNVREGSTGRYKNARERSTRAHTIHKCTRRIHRAIQKCTREIHTQGDPQMHARYAHAIQAKASALLFLCSQNYPQILLYPLFHAQQITSPFVNLCSALTVSINRCFWICGFFWDCHSVALTHKCAQAYLYTLPMEWMK